MAEETDVQSVTPSDDDENNTYSDLTAAVSQLVEIMHKKNLERLEVAQGDLRINLSARTETQTGADGAQSAIVQAPVAANAPAAEPDEPAEAPPWHQITSPMVGTFYEAPSPGEPPFVQPGDRVEVGQTVAIIEAMKIMNEIIADRSGVIDAVLVENGETVEYGHPLFRMRPA